MSSNYSRLGTVADRMIEKYGCEVTIKRPSATSFSPASGIYTGATFTDYTAKAAIMPATKKGDLSTRSGMLLSSELRSLLVSSEDLAITPQPGDRVVIDSETWVVLGNTPLAPNGSTTVMHRLGIKRGG